MRCPKCGYNSFDHLDSCRKCGKELTEHKQRYGIKSVLFPGQMKPVMATEHAPESADEDLSTAAAATVAVAASAVAGSAAASFGGETSTSEADDFGFDFMGESDEEEDLSFDELFEEAPVDEDVEETLPEPKPEPVAPVEEAADFSFDSAGENEASAEDIAPELDLDNDFGFDIDAVDEPASDDVLGKNLAADDFALPPADDDDFDFNTDEIEFGETDEDAGTKGDPKDPFDLPESPQDEVAPVQNLKVIADQPLPLVEDADDLQPNRLQESVSDSAESVAVAFSDLPVDERPDPAAVKAEFELPEVNEPAVELLEVNELAVELPEVNESAVELPEANESAVELPEVNELAVELPEVNESAVELPEVNESAVELPEVNEPAVELPEVNEPAVAVRAEPVAADDELLLAEVDDSRDVLLREEREPSIVPVDEVLGAGNAGPGAVVAGAVAATAMPPAESTVFPQEELSAGQSSSVLAPSPVRRIVAFFCDLALLSGVAASFIIAAEAAMAGSSERLLPSLATLIDLSVPYFLVLFSLAFSYFTLFHFLVGQTPGKMLTGLRVETLEGDPLGLSQAFLRSVGGLLQVLPAGLGYLVVLLSPDRRGWNDRLAGTRLISLQDRSEDLTA